MKPFLPTLLLAAAGGAVQAAGLGSQLIVNGGAEAGSTAGWVSNGYEVSSTALSGHVGLAPGTDIGAFSFWGGTGAAASQTLAQAVDVGSFAALIDAGQATSHFSILLQSRRNATIIDSITGELRFLNAQQGLLASVALADSHVVNNVLDWNLATDLRSVPVGTRTIEVFLEGKRGGGIQTDAFADNASLTITSSVPEPATALLWLPALLAFSVWRSGRPARR